MTAGWAYVVLWGVLLAILAVLHLAFDLDGLQLGLAIGAAAGRTGAGGAAGGTAPTRGHPAASREQLRDGHAPRWAP